MKVGIADTTFARADMAAWALDELTDVERYTVPGMKDLPLACKLLVEKHGCQAVLALAWVGPEEIDERCAHEANVALHHAELLAGKHILKVFVHEREASGSDLLRLAENRVRKHARNALKLLEGKTVLTPEAGTGRRQGSEDEGAL